MKIKTVSTLTALLLIGSGSVYSQTSLQTSNPSDHAVSNDPSEKLRDYLKSGDVKDFTELAQKSVVDHKSDAKILDEVAWIIVCPSYVGDNRPMIAYTGTMPHPVEFQKKELLDLALDSVKNAVKMTNRSNAAYLDTLGWAYYRLGKYHEACDSEFEAANKQTDEATKDVYFFYAGWFCK